MVKLSRQRKHQIEKEYKNTGRQRNPQLYNAVYKKICEICNTLNTIALHHKDGNNKNDVMENLISVCQKCHVSAHVMLRDGNGYNKLYKICKSCNKDFTEYAPLVEKGFCKPCFNFRKYFNNPKKT